ncbi:prephenate dehydrogenase [Shimia abyssi]|uniref:Prephenate dehydrogenase n=1 Tax=Shimia abyssi TaxID=1662395 RepID=A0A2P8FDC4_9RHOB|nr:prephenate dehydrogenase [Shimia abyssi]PSL19707.1 prephenate dehydrogenase [Shimia abyssi]
MGLGKRPRLGLIGFGGFGRLMAGALCPHMDILVCDPAYVGAVLDTGQALPMGTLEDAAQCDIVVLCIPVARVPHLCARLAPLLKPGTLVVDVGSVKVEPMRVMDELLPSHVDIVGTHPLFGPQSARDGIAGHKIAVCPLRGVRWRSVAGFLRRIGLDVIVTTPEAHDREAAMVQGLTHLIAKVLAGMGPLPERMTTASFEHLRAAIGMVQDDPPTVLHAIETANPYAADIRSAFFERAERLRVQFDGV